jgi:hypothetical protein
MTSHETKNLDSGFIWVIGRRQPKDDPNVKADWHLQGIATTESIAVEMCLDETYFIGPLPLDLALPHKTVQWVGLYFPLGPNAHTTQG